MSVSAWLASQGASLLLGFLAKVISDAIGQWQANKNTSDLGRLTAERDQAIAATRAKDAELTALANAPADVDAAARRLEEGTG